MIDKKIIKKVAGEVMRIRKECQSLHDEIMAKMNGEEVQMKLTYIYDEMCKRSNTCISVSGMKTFSRDFIGALWGCYIDGGSKTNEAYPLEDEEKIVSSLENNCRNKNEEEQISSLRTLLEVTYSSLNDHLRFKETGMMETLKRIDDWYNEIKAKRAESLARLLADYRI